MNFTADIKVTREGESLENILNLHAITIVNPGEVPHEGANGETIYASQRVGAAEIGGKRMWLSSEVLSHKPEKFGKYKNTGFDAYGRSTLERAFAHETGHLMKLLDVYSPDGNLMIQAKNSNAGTKVTGDQINKIVKFIQDEKKQ